MRTTTTKVLKCFVIQNKLPEKDKKRKQKTEEKQTNKQKTQKLLAFK